MLKCNKLLKIVLVSLIILGLIPIIPVNRAEAAGSLTLTGAGASSTLSGFSTSSLIDGNLGTFWTSTNHTGKNNTEWFYVTFSTTTVSKIELYPNQWGYQCFPNRYYLQYTTDGGTTWNYLPGGYFEVGSEYGKLKSNVTSPVTIEFNPISANGIKVIGTQLTPDDSGNYFMQMAEVKVYPAEWVTITSTSVSSTLTGHDKSYLTDGSYSAGNYWCSASHTTESNTEWVRADFAFQTISQINIYPNPSSSPPYYQCFAKDFKIEYTDDGGTTWQPIPGQTYTDYPGASRTPLIFRFSPVAASGIRITATKLNCDSFGGYYLQISEIKIPVLSKDAVAEITPSGAFTSSSYDAGHNESKLWNNTSVQGDFWTSSQATGADVSSNPISAGIYFPTACKLNTIELYPRRENGVNYCFPSKFNLYYSADGGTHWYLLPTEQYQSFSTTDSVAIFTFGTVVANAVKVTASTLTQDNYNNYFFQLAEIRAYGPAGAGTFIVSSSASGPSSSDINTSSNLNNFWYIYGLGDYRDGLDTDTSQPLSELGGRMTWNEKVTGTGMEFVPMKLDWSTEYPDYLFKTESQHLPTDYISPTDQRVWEVETYRRHLDSWQHYDNNSDFLIGITDALRWTGDTSVLTAQYPDRSFSYGLGTQKIRYRPTPNCKQYVGPGAYVGEVFKPSQSFDSVGLFVDINPDATKSVSFSLSLYKVIAGADDQLIASTNRTLSYSSTPEWSWQEMTVPTQTDTTSYYHIVIQNLCSEGTFWDHAVAVETGDGSPSAGYGTIAGTINGNVDVDKMNYNLSQRMGYAMNYQNNTLAGMVSGIGKVSRIPDSQVTGSPVSDYTNTTASLPCNYYDLVRMGYKTVYDNIEYYRSLLGMSLINGIGFLNNPTAKAAYDTAGSQVKTDFDAVFWNSTTGRYNAWQDASGGNHDYGFTAPNLNAVVLGMGDSTKRQSIMDWISGARTVSGDSVAGANIYYGSMAPRTNTKDLKDSNNLWYAGNPAYWDWRSDGLGLGDYGNQEENGGTSLFISYYDIMARLQMIGKDNAWSRLNSILTDFQTDAYYRRQPADTVHAYGTGYYKAYTMDLPEVGLVPCTMVYGFEGLSGFDSDGYWEINPNIPSAFSYATVDNVRYKDRSLRVTGYNTSSTTVEVMPNSGSSTTSLKLKFGNLTANHTYQLKNIKASGTTLTNYTSDSNGKISLDAIDVGTDACTLKLVY